MIKSAGMIEIRALRKRHHLRAPRNSPHSKAREVATLVAGHKHLETHQKMPIPQGRKFCSLQHLLHQKYTWYAVGAQSMLVE